MPVLSNSVQSDLRSRLKQHGLRATAQRLAVLALLREQKGPISHDEVMGLLESGMYDKASIWRVLSDFAGVGIVRRMDVGDRIWRYELLDANHTISDEHPHFLCVSCGEVTCLPPLELRALGGGLPEALAGAQYQIRVSGSCSVCLGA